ncbi:g809 [Coccomyxa elongata]
MSGPGLTATPPHDLLVTALRMQDRIQAHAFASGLNVACAALLTSTREPGALKKAKLMRAENQRNDASLAKELSNDRHQGLPASQADLKRADIVANNSHAAAKSLLLNTAPAVHLLCALDPIRTKPLLQQLPMQLQQVIRQALLRAAKAADVHLTTRDRQGDLLQAMRKLCPRTDARATTESLAYVKDIAKDWSALRDAVDVFKGLVEPSHQVGGGGWPQLTARIFGLMLMMLLSSIVACVTLPFLAVHTLFVVYRNVDVSDRSVADALLQTVQHRLMRAIHTIYTFLPSRAFRLVDGRGLQDF